MFILSQIQAHVHWHKYSTHLKVHYCFVTMDQHLHWGWYLYIFLCFSYIFLKTFFGWDGGKQIFFFFLFPIWQDVNIKHNDTGIYQLRLKPWLQSIHKPIETDDAVLDFHTWVLLRKARHENLLGASGHWPHGSDYECTMARECFLLFFPKNRIQ